MTPDVTAPTKDAVAGGVPRSWRICDHTAFVVSSPERVVVYNLDEPRTQPLALLGTGAAIWQCLIGPDDEHLRLWCPEVDVLSDLAEAYQTSSEAIAPDVTALLAELADGGYVEFTPND